MAISSTVIVAPAAGSTNDSRSYETSLAGSRLGVAPQNLLAFYHLSNASYTNGVTSTVTSSGTVTNQIGGIRLATGVTAGSISRLIGGTDGGNFTQYLRAGAAWYISARFSVNTAIVAGTTACCGSHDGGGGMIRMGVHGGTSTTNFTLTGPAGAAMDSGIPIDTSKHTFRAWRVNSLTNFEIDGVLTNTGGAVDLLATAESPFALCQDTAGGTNRSMDVVWFAAFVAQL